MGKSAKFYKRTKVLTNQKKLLKNSAKAKDDSEPIKRVVKSAEGAGKAKSVKMIPPKKKQGKVVKF